MDERKFAFALIVSAVLHMFLLPALFLFATGTAPVPVRPFADSSIRAFLVPEASAPAGGTEAPSVDQRGTGWIAPAAAPAETVFAEQAAKEEVRGESVRREALKKSLSEEKGDGKPPVEDRTLQAPSGGIAGRGEGVEVPVSSLPAPKARASAGSGAEGGRTSTPVSRAEGEEGFRPAEGPAPPLDADAVPRYRDNARPAYPPLARIRGYQGAVVLEVEVLADGRVGQVEIKRSAGRDILDRAAQEAVRTWKFDPGRRGGRAVAMSVEVPVRFVLNGYAVR